MSRTRSLLICGLAGLGLVACGSSSSTSSTAGTTPAATAPAPATRTPASTPAGATKLALAADPSGQLAFLQKSLAARAGKVTIDFTNTAPVPHDVAVAAGSKQLGVTPVFSGGGTDALTLTLAKGTYTYYCTVSGHRQAGMEGTLTVS